ncbi:MAG: hypothetical protein ABIR91_03960, partial [Candidatus Saccharimonadales bacterium]
AQIAKEQYLLTSIIEMYLTGVLFTRVRNSLYVIEQDKPGGNVHLYFGGDDGPLGDNHGHLVLNPGRRIDFLRYPGEKRGPQNDFRLPPQDTTVELAS